MQYSTAAAAFFFGLTWASPLTQRQTYEACSGLYGTEQCCATDVLGVADLDCANPPTSKTKPPPPRSDGCVSNICLSVPRLELTAPTYL